MPGVSAWAAGIYVPRLFLSNYAAGISRTFAYELLDEDLPRGAASDERHFGLLYGNFTPKPAYKSLQRLLALLADPGPSFSTTPLNLTLSGDTADLRSLLLERRDGTYELVLWRAESVFDLTKASNLPLVGRPVTITLRSPVSSWTWYRPTFWSQALYHGSRTNRINVRVSADTAVLDLNGLAAPMTGGRRG